MTNTTAIRANGIHDARLTSMVMAFFYHQFCATHNEQAGTDYGEDDKKAAPPSIMPRPFRALTHITKRSQRP